MKIAILNTFYAGDIVGGAEIVVMKLAERLKSYDYHKVKVFSLGKNENKGYVKGVEVDKTENNSPIWLPNQKTSNTLQKIRHNYRKIYNPLTARTVSQKVYEYFPDIIHIHNIQGFSPLIFFELKKRMPNVPIVVTLHDYWAVCPKNTLLHSSGELCVNRHLFCKLNTYYTKHYLRYVAAFVSPSKFLGEKVSKEIKMKDKFYIINNGIFSENDSCKGPFEQKKSKKVNFLYLGQLTKHKGVKTLLKAINLLKCINFQFHIAGSGVLEKDVLKNDRVIYHGKVYGKQKEQLLRNSDVLVIPSEWYENNPLVILEGFQYGLAIIGAKIGGIPELVMDRQNGLLFMSGNAEELANKILQLCNEHKMLAKLQKKACEMSKEYSIEKMIKQYINLYKKLLKG